MSALKVGLVGATPGKGWSPVAHIPALKALDSVELTALCTSRPESAKAASKAFDIERVYYNVKELVAQPDLDIVSVVVKIPNHFEVVKAALEAKKHVYCEWPLGGTLQETEELTKLAVQKGLTTAIGLQGHWAPELVNIKQLFEDGWFGQVIRVNMTMKSKASSERNSMKAWEDEKHRNATLFSIVGGHTLYYLSHIFGSITEVSAQISTQFNQLLIKDTEKLVDNHIADQIDIQGFLDNSIPFTSQIFGVPYHSDGWRLEIYGTEGTIIATSEIMPQITPIKLKGSKGDSELKTISVLEERKNLKDLPKGPANNVGRNYRQMVEAVINKKAFHPSFEDALNMHRLLEAIKKSSKEKRTVKTLYNKV